MLAIRRLFLRYHRQWLDNIEGNDKIHHLLTQGTYEMRMDMKDFSNEEHHVKYSSFYVGNEFTNYTVTLSGFSGDVGEIYKCP